MPQMPQMPQMAGRGIPLSMQFIPPSPFVTNPPPLQPSLSPQLQVSPPDSASFEEEGKKGQPKVIFIFKDSLSMV